VPAPQFNAWVSQVKATKPPLTLTDYRSLLKFNWVKPSYYSSYPAATFPAETHGFTLNGGMYMEMQPTPK
jgi:cytochrome aa3-600 menaquinol oxidase subunit 2